MNELQNDFQTTMRLEHQNIHFIGCTHFGHSNVIKFEKKI